MQLDMKAQNNAVTYRQTRALMCHTAAFIYDYFLFYNGYLSYYLPSLEFLFFAKRSEPVIKH